jgi:hypothetical protein
MTPYPSPAQDGLQTVPVEGVFPLHRLPNICCSSGACREVESWPMGVLQDGWLQLDQHPQAEVPVDLIAFSTRGVTVALKAAVPLQPEAPGQLLTQAHGAGLSHRSVRICWHRPHPQDPERQLAGLRFAADAQT